MLGWLLIAELLELFIFCLDCLQCKFCMTLTVDVVKLKDENTQRKYNLCARIVLKESKATDIFTRFGISLRSSMLIYE